MSGIGLASGEVSHCTIVLGKPRPGASHATDEMSVCSGGKIRIDGNIIVGFKTGIRAEKATLAGESNNVRAGKGTTSVATL